MAEQDLPTDPFNGDTDGRPIQRQRRKSVPLLRRCPATGTGHCYVGRRHEPNLGYTNGDHIPDAWESVYRGNGMSLTDHSKGMDGTYDDQQSGF
jgi:hypothetical protein